MTSGFLFGIGKTQCGWVDGGREGWLDGDKKLSSNFLVSIILISMMS